MGSRRMSTQIFPVRLSAAQQDAAYFHSYNHVGIHEEMIKDRIRTEAYRDAIFAHQEAIKDKVVIDVGCGTGILSIFCAAAGARKVYAVDASDIAVQAREVVKANGFSDVITVIVGRVEEIQLEEKADVIISEWMGYMLLYETMLPSVVCARDRWLKPGGLMLPSFATLYMAPITNPDRYGESIDFWRNVYGFDMSAILPLAKQCAFEEPCVEVITAENVKRIDCSTVTLEELETVTTTFSVPSIMRAHLHGFALWFNVSFGGDASCLPKSKAASNGTIPLVLSTAPEDPPTHWAQVCKLHVKFHLAVLHFLEQTILYVYEPVELQQDNLISGTFTMSQCKENPRFLNVHIEYSCGDRHFVKESVMR
ncbi:probable protein arginine N-methyltransferase 6 isoform X2 [Selaginella moellendorffii]|uniref:probable protein arginine N-methyltransferase 6 isoform X2 n=1 Tax=Selaginella moellendorffii TaxID=88036 RepID=UPI000D1D07E5|nr:probable protein arginine N-methyltransferase 6 isoform X2 [Selaginella moellendorffii]|eukprot:XP_024522317.1 probable protein arginine N-methyltransferase 6 isoform X2 [Selaginella moellendorffii]